MSHLTNVCDSYIIFGVFCTVMTFHIFFTYPETARKTLEEIDAVFDSNIPPWKSSKVQENALEARAHGISKGYGEKDGEVDQKEVV